MKNSNAKMKTTFKPGQSVVLKRANGDSVSGTITVVRLTGARNADNDNVTVSWIVGPRKVQSEQVYRPDFGRITPFNQSLFLAL